MRALRELRAASEGTPNGTAGPKIANFDRIEWRIIPDPSTVAAAMQKGEIDWWLVPEADLLPLLRKHRSLKVENIIPTGFVATMRFNQLNPPFDNVALRRAMLGAVNQSDYMIGMVGTDATLWNDPCGVFTPDTPMASDAGMQVLTSQRDLGGEARSAAAGYKGEKVVILDAHRHRLRQGARRHHHRHAEAARHERR